MIEYTFDEAAQLCSMVDILRDNANNFTVKFRKGITTYTPPEWVIATEDTRHLIEQIIRFITYTDKREIVTYSIYEAPLEDMPLLINETDGRQIIARWRLRIGR